MEEKMGSENSYSGDSTTSSDSSSGSSECDEEVTETVRILGQTLELPQDLCEDYSIFREFFSMKTWDCLEDKHKEHLKKLLPTFTDNDEEEKDTTIQMLFNFEPFHFKSPLNHFFSNLRQGNYRPDIARMRKFLKKARAKQQRHKIKSYYAKMLPEVLISRERLLAVAKASPPGQTPYIPDLPPKPSSKNSYKPIYVRARQRYFEELNAIWSEIGAEESEDENFPEGPPEKTSKKRKTLNSGQNTDSNVSGTLGAMEPSHPASLACLKNVLATHRARRQYRENHPELNTIGITLDDIKQRVALINGTKKLMFGGHKIETPTQKVRKGTKKDKSKQQDIKLSQKRIKEEQDSLENKPLLPNIKIKCEQEGSDSESSSFLDPVCSPKHNKKILEPTEIKQEITDMKYYNTNGSENDLDRAIKQEPQDSLSSNLNLSRICQPVPIKLEDLDGIDMMALPVELADDSGDVMPVDTSTETIDEVVVEDEALTETTHANFLSLVRALFPARAAHRASKQQLHSRCSAVMRSPIAPLNTWYSLSDDWCAELNSALDFLAGERGPHPEDFVPYLQYMPDTQMYQWIGAGRDCDAILGRLCERWLRAASPPPVPNEPPPPRYPTSWVVRQPTATEVAEFRAQERRRFASATKPFTYVQYGYRAVVGPVSGWRGVAAGAGGALLAPQRPRAAAFLPLLRDALARLPNGEGDRRDLITLLRMSQWIVPCSDQALWSAASSALEKLLSVKRDPVVKYEQRTATWTYLHRHKSEEDWYKNSNSRKTTAKPTSANVTSSQMAMEMDVANVEEVIDNASDSDVDVDDTSLPTSAPHLSSAQLLMQATQTTPKAIHVPKPKGKLVPTPQKPKTVPTKQTPAKMPSLVQTKQNPQTPRQTISISQSNISVNSSNKPILAQAKQTSLLNQSPKPVISVKSSAAKQNVIQTKNVVKQGTQSPKQTPKQSVVPAKSVPPASKPTTELVTAQVSTAMPSIVITPQRSPLMKQKPISKLEVSQAAITLGTSIQQNTPATSVLLQSAASTTHHHTAIGPSAKLTQVTRSLLIRPSAIQTTATSTTATVCAPATQVTPSARRSVVRVLSPATPTSGKSLISPRALMQQNTPVQKKRPLIHSTTPVTTIVQSTATNTSGTTVVSSTSASATRSLQLAGHTVQLSGGHALLSPLLPAHTVRLPSGQTVQLASPHTLQALRVAPPHLKTTPRTQSTIKPLSSVQVPVSTVQLGGQTVQIAGQTVQLSGQMQLTGHTVKLPSGQSVQVASQSVLPSQSVQLHSGQTVQLASGNVQTVQIGGQNVQLSGQVQLQSGQSVQLGSQTVRIGGQTVQLSGGQTVQLPSGQTLQLPSGQTVQLSSGQTLQLASGQTLQLANQTPKSVAQVVRTQTTDEKSNQPIVAKLLTNNQTQMISLEGAGVAGRARGVRVLAPTRPLLLAAGKPLHNIILQQSDGTTVRMTSSGGTSTSQTIVLSNLGGQGVSTSTATTPVLKLQQVNQLHQVKLPQGIKFQQAVSSASPGVRSVLMDGQQLKLVGGRHVLARLLRPTQPQPPPQ